MLEAMLEALKKQKAKLEAMRRDTAKESGAMRSELEELKKIVSAYVQKAETVQISTLRLDMLANDGFVCESVCVSSVQNVEFVVPEAFVWPVPDKEADPRNKNAYLLYLQEFLDEFKTTLTVKTSIEKAARNTTVGIAPHHLNGNADLYVMPATCIKYCRNQLVMVVEMKPTDLQSDDLAQAIGYAIAANTLFEIAGRPAPIGLLTDFREQWCLIWIGPGGIIKYAEQELDASGFLSILTRKTALHYIRKHMAKYHELLKVQRLSGGSTDSAEWAFGDLQSGFLKKQRREVGEDNMLDLLETDEEIRLYEMHKRMRQTPLFDIY
ncbi:hypothetical protein BDR26DRAFT_888142 [Obelidium mucronatum]|nr:hypothetical protein BDR26DRAFT_888142 [Obelidium mucronatum]